MKVLDSNFKFKSKNVVYKNSDVESTLNELKQKTEEGLIFSTTETRIGTWIDGKPLYRKVIESYITISPGANVIPHNVVNLFECTDLKYRFIYGNQSFYHWNNDVRDVYVDDTNIVIKSGNVSAAGFTKTVCTIEYTKTTD